MEWKVYIISKSDFPDDFENLKNEADVSLLILKPEGEIDLPDFWTLKYLLGDVPYFTENADDEIRKMIDLRIQNLFSGIEINDSFLGRILKERFTDLLNKNPVVENITPENLVKEVFPFGELPKHKEVLNSNLEYNPLQKALLSRGKAGLIFTAMFEKGFFTPPTHRSIYPILAQLTGHSLTGWSKAFAGDLPTLISRHDDISYKDLEFVYEFLSTTAQAIRESTLKIRKFDVQKNDLG